MFRICLLILGLFLTLSFKVASAMQLFNNEAVKGDYELPKTYGLSLDYYKIDQSYDIDQLTLAIPAGGLNPSGINVENDVEYTGLKFDAWILPYLNIFAVLGEIDGVTTVDLSSVRIPGLPVSLGEIDINFDGEVYGAGFTLAVGSKKWFSSITTSYTDTSLEGRFESSVNTLTVQPRVGLRHKNIDVWLGATYLSADESHQGSISLGAGLPAIPFDVELSSDDKINYGAGLKVNFVDNIDLIAEFGVGGREHGSVSLAWRF